ncbi:acyl-CoA dehydrogenase [Streptomyces sp. NRRL B-1568]|nr:acyl-CoA dehydrogenase [Streptomyces sp. NRRL B-1568]
MDFRPDDDQRALKAGMRELLKARFPRERLREAADADRSGPAFDRALWRALGEAGLFSLRLSEKDGGAGLGLPEAVLVFEEAGRALLPGPLVATHLAAGYVPGAAEGAAVVTAVDRPGMVEHLDASEAVLLLNHPGVHVLSTAGGTGREKLPGRPVRSVDPTTPLYDVRQLPPAVTDHAMQVAAPGADRLRREAALLTAAQQLGSASRTLEMAVDHARTRIQFGRPIGTFQAVQHLCAQMLVRAEIARSSVHAASLTMTACDISAAKLLADDAAVRNARDCLQLHGGLGFSWDMDVHLHLKRSWLRLEQWQGAYEAEEVLAAALPNGPAEGVPDHRFREID